MERWRKIKSRRGWIHDTFLDQRRHNDVESILTEQFIYFDFFFHNLIMKHSWYLRCIWLKECTKYLLWVSEGIGGYRKWWSIVYVYGFEQGYRKLTEYEQVLTISIQNRVSEILEGYRKCTNGIRNIRRISEMYEGYRKI